MSVYEMGLPGQEPPRATPPALHHAPDCARDSGHACDCAPTGLLINVLVEPPEPTSGGRLQSTANPTSEMETPW